MFLMAARAPPSKTLEKSQKIRCVQDNPKQKGTACRDRYEKYKSATTVKEFYEKEGTPADLDHDIGRGFIEVIQPTRGRRLDDFDKSPSNVMVQISRSAFLLIEFLDSGSRFILFVAVATC